MASGRMLERGGAVRDSYFALVNRFPLRPIRNDRELNRAIAMIDSLIESGSIDSGESDYLEVLSDLVKRYEDEHEPRAQLTDAAMLAHLLEAKGVSQAEAAQATNISSSTLSEVLSGKRTLTRGHVRRLADYFGVGAGVFS